MKLADLTVAATPLDGAVHGSLDGFLADDLDRLCADRPLVGNEWYPFNAFYGQAGVLRRYAGLPDRPLPMVVEHGLRFDGQAWDADLNSPLPTLAVASGGRARALRSGPAAGRRKRVEAIGFGSLYAADLVRREHGPDPAPAERPGGTLAFPSHSTHHIEVLPQVDQMLARWEALPERFRPVVICLYWKDLLAGRAEPYRAAGFPVVSAGQMYSPTFLPRLHALCRQFRYATACGVGTHVFVASSAGCRFFFTPKVETIWKGSEDRLREMSDIRAVHDRARLIFGETPPDDPADGAPADGDPADGDPAGEEAAGRRAAFVAEHLGTASQRTPEDLRRLVRESERKRLVSLPWATVAGVSKGLARSARRAAGRTYRRLSA